MNSSSKNLWTHKFVNFLLSCSTLPKTEICKMDLCSPKRQQILTNKTILKRRFCKVCQGWQRVYMWHEIKVKMNMWQVNPTETQTRSVNVWTSTRSDLPPEIYMTYEISFILLKPQDFPETSHTRRDLKFCLTGLWCMKCCIKYTWHMTF